VVDVDQVQAMYDTIYQRFGRLDVLLNNAGYVISAGKLAECTTAEFDKTMNVNCAGAWNVMKFGIQTMIKCGNGGRIARVCRNSVQNSIVFTGNVG